MSYPLLTAAANVHAPAIDTAAVITITGVAGKRIVISHINASYDVDPTTVGKLIVQTGASLDQTVFSTFVTKSGPAPIPFQADFMKSGTGVGFKVTLPAAGATVTGVLSVYWKWE